ncbi:MAG TPA: hypothetical protein VEB41_06460 [Burkholderiales bacterium]|nr:hypothetical protein [Burkholderiales bacterium]
MRKTLVAISLLAAPFLACAQATQPQQQPPGYGVVESVTRLPTRAVEESASAGASARPSSRQKTGYLVRIRMDDGSVQVRSVRRAEVKPGQRALITNAGDVVPE